MSTNNVVALIAVAILAIGCFWLGNWSGAPTEEPRGFGSNVNGGNVTDYDAVNTLAGYWVNSIQIADDDGINAASVAKLQGGTLKSYAIATSTTAGTQTLLQADIVNYDTILLTSNTGALSLALPASSTLTTMVPAAGDRQQLCIVNATTTTSVAGNITITTGTGINLQSASTTPIQGAIVSGGKTACIEFIRLTSTDVNAAMTIYK